MATRKTKTTEESEVQEEGLVKKHTLFEITDELDSIFMELEENGGELTPEIEKRLAITEKNFNNKVQSYYKAIKALDVQINACKEEKKRINDLQKRDEKSKDFLRRVIADVTSRFGRSTDSGNAIDLPLGKVYTRTVKSIEVDTNLMQWMLDLLKEFYESKMKDGTVDGIYEDTHSTIDEFCKFVNIKLRNESDLGVDIDFGPDDLAAIRLKVTYNCNFFDIMFDQWAMERFVDGTSDVVVDSPAEYIKAYEKNSGNEFKFAKKTERVTAVIK